MKRVAHDVPHVLASNMSCIIREAHDVPHVLASNMSCITRVAHDVPHVLASSMLHVVHNPIRTTSIRKIIIFRVASFRENCICDDMLWVKRVTLHREISEYIIHNTRILTGSPVI